MQNKQMQNKQRLSLLVLAAAVGVGVFLLAPDRAPQGPLSGTEQPESPVVTTDAEPTLTWPKGRAVTSRFEWAHAQSTVVAGSALRADVALRGTLEVVGLGLDGDAWRARARLLSLDEARYEVLGSNLAAAASEWVGRDVFVRYSRTGALLDVTVPATAQADEAFPLVLRALLQASQAQTVAEGEEETVLGRSSVRYAGEGLVRDRARDRYLALEGLDVAAHDVDVKGSASVRFSADGYVASLESTDTVTARRGAQEALSATSRLTWRALSSRKLAASEPLPALAAARDLRRGPSPELEQKLLVAQAAGLTKDQLVADLSRFVDRGDAPEPAWLPRAAAVIRLNPEVSADIAELATSARATTDARALGLDLLTQVGHEQAQAATRALLSADSVRKDPAYAFLVQRIGYVAAPTAQTLAFAETLRSDEDADIRRAATYSYGALAKGLAAGPRAVEATRITTALADELSRSDVVEDRVALLGALGNASTADSYGAVVGYAADKEAKLRHAAATALRGSEDRAHREALLGLMGDREVAVQRAAMRSLAEGELAAHEQRRIAEIVGQGQTARANDPLVVTLLQQRVTGDARDRALRFVLERADDDARLRARIRGILGGR